ncbi:RNA polymerase sporulation sigma factor SigF [Clostridium sp. CM028]|uniref:RNA polymerase sporulation sigma factor SigF n=1 Tax=Clostridium TaxID=1485 RepID=UPI0013EE77DF|nr:MULTISPECIES: RNA polymerase sporulation sigma factor SigF [Clostridium]MBU3092946.1 RNA polymerase sporulation sigma factor SigF [Clostridium sp. CF011]MBW9143972.1 RNA polymerase sporulation sigma factor SigF [Clostridium sp. CM027]MBW9147712.1 RNA polymerase sporulation sigma factor SigF [Clostridium sp. CM028]MBZ9608154.1 RNA polymerase sporulation sigma factor SigF [Clostridium estertheticum]UVE41368.1 RNA polymerase sporulation sigma factor SigF [Clostridium sp. CM027]
MDQKIVRKENYTYEDNMQLIQLARNKEPGALDTLVEMNLPLVSSISKKFLNRGYEYDDIFQIGCIGLVKAINNFDTKYNVKFSTYAVPMIMGEIKRFLRDDGIIKVSRSVKITARQLHYDKDTLTKELGREPTIDELSVFSKIEKEDIVYALESASNMLYLFDTIHQDDGAPVLLIDKLSEKYEEDNQVLDKISLKEALRKLDAKSRQIIMLRYFKDNTQIQVAKMMGISQVQVSRIEKKVLKIMREKLI